MEYRRTEVRKVLRHREYVNNPVEIKLILEKLKEKNIRFQMQAKTIGPLLLNCTIISIKDGSFEVFSPSPKKVQTIVKFDDIELLDFESNVELITEEDDGGRWARIM